MRPGGRPSAPGDADAAARRASASAGARYALVLAREHAAGRAIAATVIEKPRLSVWTFLVPFLLVDYVYRCRTHEAGVEAFARECIRERELALDAALAAVERGLEKAEALGALAPERGAGGPEAAAAVRRAQRGALDVLFDHYERLLHAEGESYEALLREAYGTGARYARFLDRLGAIERELGRAILRSLPEAAPLSDVVARTMDAADAARIEEARKIFS